MDITSTGPPVLSNNERGRPYPDPETSLGRAWARVWDHLETLDAGDYVEGRDLAFRHHGTLAEATVMGLLSRAVKAGKLEVQRRPAVGVRGSRLRAFYRIKR